MNIYYLFLIRRAYISDLSSLQVSLCFKNVKKSYLCKCCIVWLSELKDFLLCSPGSVGEILAYLHSVALAVRYALTGGPRRHGQWLGRLQPAPPFAPRTVETGGW